MCGIGSFLSAVARLAIGWSVLWGLRVSAPIYGAAATGRGRASTRLCARPALSRTAGIGGG